MDTYTNFYTVRLSDEEEKTIRKLADLWDRARAQTLRDCIALGRLAAQLFEQDQGRPANDAIEIAERVLFRTDPCGD